MLRMAIISFTIFVLTFLQAQHPHQSGHSSYSEFKEREIKALSESQINGYLNGAGMGQALAAELNRYPGPKHVLELLDELVLSDAQIEQTQTIYDEMHKKAVELGKQIVAKERHLDSLFASERITPGRLEKMVTYIALLKGRLRLTHMKAHLRMRAILREDQIEKYDRLRGYSRSDHLHRNQ